MILDMNDKEQLIKRVIENTGSFGNAIVETAYHICTDRCEISISDGYSYGTVKIYEDDTVSYDDSALTIINDYKTSNY